jgi:hypothetical protein
MAGRQCHHCKQWIEPGEAHDCWTTTEAALTRLLPEDLREAWERLRETASGFGPQRIYASGRAIMFSRKTCYFFVRPRKKSLQVCVFLGRAIKAPQVRCVARPSKAKVAHLINITHRDEVEGPVVKWLREAYDVSDALSKAHLKPEKSTVVHAASHRFNGPDPKKDDGAQLNRVRRICASIPGATEKISHGEPTFFTPKRVFVMCANNHHGDGRVAAWIPAAPGVQEALIEEAPDAYFRPPYVGGAGWVGVELSKVGDEQLGALIREAFRLMTAKAIRPARAKSTRRASAGREPAPR